MICTKLGLQEEDNMKDNKGFSLLELIIVIAIMAVLIGVIAPNYVSYFERSKKMTDVDTADKIAEQFELMVAYYAATSHELFNDPSGSNTMAWQKEDILVSTGMTEEEFIEHYSQPNVSGEYHLGGMLFEFLGTIPVSETNKDYGWNVSYEPTTGAVNYIHLIDVDSHGNVSLIEVYPNYYDFVYGS